MEVSILNTKISMIRLSNPKFTFKNFEAAYLNSVLMGAGLGRIEDCMVKIDHSRWELLAIGVDATGSICVNQNRNLKMSFDNVTYLRTIVNKASRLATCDMSIQKNFSYRCVSRHELYEDESCTLNTFKVEPQGTLDLLTKMYDIEENRIFLESKGEMFNQYLNMFIGNAVGAEMSIPIDQLFNLYQSSRSYRIVSELVRKDLLSGNSIKLRKHIYPGQPGGLLSALMDFKSIEPDFSFDFDRILSPEMMSLKSSQPESFMSNLVTNIKEKFNQLYTSSDKEAISRSLIGMSDIMDDESYHGRLLSLLTTWGYIGVMGSLEEMDFTKKQANYKSIRFRGAQPIFNKINESTLKCLIRSLAVATQKHNYFNDMEIVRGTQEILLCKNWHDFQKTFISLVHSYVLNSSSIVSTYITHTPNLEFIKISKTLQLLIQDIDFCESLMSGMSGDPALMLIPVTPQNQKDLMIMLETLLNNFVYGNKQDVKFRYERAIQHCHELRQPYVITRDILSGTKLGFDARIVHYHGFLNREAVNFFQSNKIHIHEGNPVNVNFSMGELNDLKIPFNKSYYIKNKMAEDTEESDEYYDILMELESDDPDLDTLADAAEEKMLPDYNRRMRLRHSRGFCYMPYFDVKVFIMPGLKSDKSDLDYIRNSATTILIVTNLYISDLVEAETECIQIFRRPEAIWENKTLIDPDCLLFYLLDYDEIDVSLWENVLDSTCLDKRALAYTKNTSPTNLIVIENGDTKSVDRYMSLEDKLDLMKVDEKEDDEEPIEEKEIVSIEDEREKICEGLKADGYSMEFIEFIDSKLQNFNKMGVKEVMRLMISKFIDGAKLMDSMKQKTKMSSKKILSELEDAGQATKIFEVASVFSSGTPNPSNYKNKALKDPGLRAELNCFYDKLTDYILSGTLTISKSEFTTVVKFCKAMRRYAMAEKHDRDQKLFFLDLFQMIANDAYHDGKGEHDHIFSSIRDKLTNLIVTDEEEDDHDFADTYRKESGFGRIYYRWSRSPDEN